MKRPTDRELTERARQQYKANGSTNAKFWSDLCVAYQELMFEAGHRNFRNLTSKRACRLAKKMEEAERGK